MGLRGEIIICVIWRYSAVLGEVCSVGVLSIYFFNFNELYFCLWQLLSVLYMQDNSYLLK